MSLSPRALLCPLWHLVKSKLVEGRKMELCRNLEVDVYIEHLLTDDYWSRKTLFYINIKFHDSFIYLCVRKIGGDKKSTLARDKVSDDLDNIFSLKVLSGVAAEDKVIAGVEDIRHDVMGLKSPGLVTELLLMIVDVGSDNIKARKNNVRSVWEELWHPHHVTAGGVKKPDGRRIRQLVKTTWHCIDCIIN